MGRRSYGRRAGTRGALARLLPLGIALPLLAPAGAEAACRCVCFNGAMRAVCGPIDPPAVCDRICPLPTTQPGSQARAPLLDNPENPDPYSDADPVIVGGKGNVAGSAGGGSGGSGAGTSVR